MRTAAVARELRRDEFGRAERVWIPYHRTRGDTETDRVFAVFAGDELVSLARCRRHPDGYEVDGVFTPEEHRGRGYAGLAMNALVEACQHDTLYMHSVLELTGWYGRYGFVPIPESELPPTIQARFEFAKGELAGANVRPMRRAPGRPERRSPGGSTTGG